MKEWSFPWEEGSSYVFSIKLQICFMATIYTDNFKSLVFLYMLHSRTT